MGLKEFSSKVWVGAVLFSIVNVFMYYSIGKFWIGGSSFLPLIGSQVQKFLFPLVVNAGVVVGTFLAALLTREFIIRKPTSDIVKRSILGGFLMGIGVTLAPGTCSTPFVTGMPMLGVNSFLSVIGIVIGAYIGYRWVGRK